MRKERGNVNPWIEPFIIRQIQFMTYIKIYPASDIFFFITAIHKVAYVVVLSLPSEQGEWRCERSLRKFSFASRARFESKRETWHDDLRGQQQRRK